MRITTHTIGLALLALLMPVAAAACGGAAASSTRTQPAQQEREAEPKLEANPTPAPAPAEPSPWSKAWRSLGETSNQCDEVFDYWPTGGMQIFYCHLLSVVGWDDLLAEAPTPIFLDGPHGERDLVLDQTSTFGRYNPEFVKWLATRLVPAAADPKLRVATAPLYDQYVAPLARIFWRTHHKLAGDGACLERELSAYRAAIAGGEYGYYERWFFFMNEAFCTRRVDEGWLMDNGFDGGVSGNVVKSAVGFWLRRELDGTRAHFVAALTVLLQTYDASWLAGHGGASTE